MPMIIPQRAYEVATWADLLALTGVPDGRVYTVLAPVCSGPGAIPGTRWRRAAGLTPTGWITAGGQRLATLTTQIDGLVNTSEQTIWEPLFEASVLASVQEIRMRARWIAAAAETNTRTARWRLRDTGAANVEIGRYQNIPTSVRWWQAPTAIYITGATSALPAGVIAATSALSPDQSANSGTAGAALVLPDLTATPIYLGATVQLGVSPSAVPSLSAASIYVE